MNDTSKCILLVEDDEDHLTLALRALRANRIVNDIVVARDGAEARDYLFGLGAHDGRDPCRTPELVLLDLKLPKVDGLDVLRRIRADERTRYTPVVVMTSSDHDEDIVRSYGLGANGFVRKPVEYEQFLDNMRAVSVYWLLVNQAPPPAPAPAA